jgi:phage shock protein A
VTDHKPPPRPTAAELAALPFEELASVVESLARCQPGCPEKRDGSCFSCRSNEIREDKAHELLRRHRELEADREQDARTILQFQAQRRDLITKHRELEAKYAALESAHTTLAERFVTAVETTAELRSRLEGRR